jgi:predicted transposase YdaD
MAKIYDGTLNGMIERHLADWVGFLTTHIGLSAGEGTSLDTDLAVTRIPDTLIRVEADPPYILHLELEASGDLGMPNRLLSYNFGAYEKHHLDVVSVVLLLHPRGNPSDLTGSITRQVQGRTYMTFEYHVIQLWKLPYEVLLNAGPGLLPLALLTNDATKDVTKAFREVNEKLRSENLSPKMILDDLGAVYFLLGLRYSPDTVRQLYQEMAMTLEQSSTYQHVIRLGLEKGLSQGLEKGLSQGLEKGLSQGLEKGLSQGRAAAMQENILHIGMKRFGSPSAEIQSQITSVTDLSKLATLLDLTLDAKSWDNVIEGL